MIITSCYVENFGKLHQYSLELTQGMNILNEENGWGKTTLAAFIEAMLYGMENKPRARLEDSIRKKYKPWQHGTFGGNMVFQVGEKEYRVERSFGEKASEDTFRLIDMGTGMESRDFSKNLGEELFKLNRLSYGYTTYLKQHHLEVYATDDIFAGLTGDAGRGTKNDMDTYSKAMKRLEDAAKEYKKTGGRGSIDKKTDLITKLTQEQRVAALNGATWEEWNGKLYAVRKQIESQKERITKLREQRILANQVEESRIKLEQLRGFKKRERDLNLQLEELEKHFTGLNKTGIAAEREKLTRYIECAERYSELEKNTQALIIQYETLAALPVNLEKIEEERMEEKKHYIASVWLVISLIFAAASGAIGYLVHPWGYAGIGLSMIFLLNFFRLLGKNKKEKTKEERKRKEKEELVEKREQSYLEKVSRKEESLRQQKELIAGMQQECREQETYLVNGLKEYGMKPGVNVITGFIMLQEMLKNSERLYEERQDVRENVEAFLHQQDVERLKEIADSKLNLHDVMEQEEEAEKYLYQLLEEEKICMEKEQAYEGERERGLELSEEIQNLKAELLEDKIEYEAICETKKLLEMAKERYSAKYLGEVTKQFYELVREAFDNEEDTHHLDASLTMSITSGGIQRELEYFSEGTKGMLWICERIAIVKTLFSEEKPILIMDDPFTDMDEKHLTVGLNLLKHLEKEFQILYLTCHESRTSQEK